jgi:CRISPR/Cas system CSM-associated protein Csm2 small subunit
MDIEISFKLFSINLAGSSNHQKVHHLKQNQLRHFYNFKQLLNRTDVLRISNVHDISNRHFLLQKLEKSDFQNGFNSHKLEHNYIS